MDGRPRFDKLAVLLAMAIPVVAQESPEPPIDPNWRAQAEQRILERLTSSGAPGLKCEFVLNSSAPGTPLEVPATGKTTILNFWRPSCGPCKPLLQKLGVFSQAGVSDVVVLAAAEVSGPLGERVAAAKAREEIAPIVQQYAVPFPVCGYTDHAQAKAWQAEGVPLTIVFDSEGRIRRAILGADETESVLAKLKDGWRP